jgi:nicotinate-nucleotide pyrophosphorylase (carboxylating)
MSKLVALPDDALRPLIDIALSEDLGSNGDITSAAVVPAGTIWQAKFNARKPGIVCGLDLARLAFAAVDPSLVFTALKQDGDAIAAGDDLATVTGNARNILSAERVALNFLCHLSGIASETHKLVEAVKPYKAKISCTRKTTPGLRLVEKYAVKSGGGVNHRFGLYDAVLIKDNHIAVAGGVAAAVTAARKAVGPSVKVELEVDNLQQLDEAIALLPIAAIDIVLLDNMDPATLKLAVEKVAGRFVTEASGGITLATVNAIAASGVDVISCGWITHSAPILDIGLDIG